MTIFEQMSALTRPFAKDGVPINAEQLQEAKIETVLATSFEECFLKRPDLENWYHVEIRKNIGL